MTHSDPLPTVILQPAPQRTARIFLPGVLQELHDRFTVVDLEDDLRREALDEVLPNAFAIIGQPALDRARLQRAPNLRAICNVEGNFFPNVDYEMCYEKGIYVLGCGPAYAQAVAEMSLGLALDIARGISREDRAFRGGSEQYVANGNDEALLLRGSTVGLLGYGNLGRALHRLLIPFDAHIRVHDPWLPDAVLQQAGVHPAGLAEVISRSQFLFVLATVTGDSEHLLGPRQLDLVPQGGRVILVSRAAIADFDALYERIRDRKFLAAIDVWPDEPMPSDSKFRALDGLVFFRSSGRRDPAGFRRDRRHGS